ncbi:hypothetical protein N7481_000735 [Penicillium waksmanii]|uniref:uncharacterized protein n=1 Tax=Penicillium waksmanii TaxID=69791 RepID=UPI002547A75A|nr:uncharacterized protein N7481_000735 [Penicillium waksmanii]KAJ6000326.1 hypothetical protein N7481_000735 [Penicillium waksmanii]
MASTILFDPPKAVVSQLSRSTTDPRPIVVMTCGIAGSGKSTLSKWIISNYQSFQRLSIDAWIYKNNGLWGKDYAAEKYNAYQEEAEVALRSEFISLLREGVHNVILDFSFAFRETRDEWKLIAESNGARWVLVYLDVEADELRRRVRARNLLEDKDGDSAFLVTEEVLERYLAGFERPNGEGEIVLREEMSN